MLLGITAINNGGVQVVEKLISLSGNKKYEIKTKYEKIGMERKIGRSISV
jgi:hypothetical protein